MIHAFIEAEKATCGVRLLCRQLGVSPSGFYDWRARHRQPCARVRDDAALTATIVEIHRGGEGHLRRSTVHAELRLGRERVERLMRAAGIQGVTRRRGRGCTRRNPEAVSAEDLVGRLFDPTGPTGCGSPTSPSTAPVTAGSTSRS